VELFKVLSALGWKTLTVEVGTMSNLISDFGLTGRIPEFLGSASDLFSGLLWAELPDRSRSAKAASHSGVPQISRSGEASLGPAQPSRKSG
jgi:hypothetical protein